MWRTITSKSLFVPQTIFTANTTPYPPIQIRCIANHLLVPNAKKKDHSKTEMRNKIISTFEIQQPTDYAKITSSSLRKLYPQLVRLYNTPYRALQSIFPDNSIQPFFWTLSIKWWRDIKNQRTFFDYVASQLGITSYEDWYHYSFSNVTRYCKDNCLDDIYQKSLYKALLVVYPQHNWLPWKFLKKSENFWKDNKIQRKFLEHIKNHVYQLDKLEDLAHLTKEDFVKAGASQMLAIHGGSISACLRANFPDINFPSVVEESEEEEVNSSSDSSNSSSSNKGVTIIRSGIWKDVSVQRKFLDEMGTKLKLKNLDEWYDVGPFKFTNIAGPKGISLLKKYNKSFLSMLSTVYSEHPWKQWKFSEKLPAKFWINTENQRAFMDHVAEKLGIRTLDEWYYMSKSVLEEIGGEMIIKSYGGIASLLIACYPEYRWDMLMFERARKAKGQLYVLRLIQEMLPDEVILYDYFHPALVSKQSGAPLQLDVYVPMYNFAIEYQGQQHYDEEHFWNKHAAKQDSIERDEEKRKLCEDHGVTVIEIPYWYKINRELIKELVWEKVPNVPFKLNRTTPYYVANKKAET